MEYRRRWLIFASILILGIATAAYSIPIPNPGHSGEKVLVYIDGGEVGLQEAIFSNLFSTLGTSTAYNDFYNINPGHNANEIWVRGQSGEEKTLQQAIVDDDVFGNPNNTLTNYSSKTKMHLATEILVMDFYEDEKSLQDAINDNTLARGVVQEEPGFKCGWKSYFKQLYAGGTRYNCQDSQGLSDLLRITFNESLSSINIFSYHQPFGSANPPTPEELCADPLQLFAGSEWNTAGNPEDQAHLVFPYYENPEGFSCELGKGQSRTDCSGNCNFVSPFGMDGDGCDDRWHNHGDCNTVPATNSYVVYCCKNVSA